MSGECHKCRHHSLECKCLQHKCKFCEKEPLLSEDNELEIIFSTIKEIYPHLGAIRKRNNIIEFGINTFYDTLNWGCYHHLPIDAGKYLSSWKTL